ncbi:MAG: hypothetical protein II866_13255 [Prevotella sp.]|nr:hypothetical protein [Prevotella sp.]
MAKIIIDANFTRNQYGIVVKECCASCKNRLLMSRKRQCRLTKRAVASGHVCRKWEMAEHLKNIGNNK